MAKKMALVADPKYLRLDAVVESATLPLTCNSQVDSSTPQWSGQRGGFLDIYADDQCQGLKGMDELCLLGICRIPLPCTMNMEPKNEGLEDDFPFQRGDLQNSC